ncbi:MAG: hypothetical protein BWY82_01866 [Verrucomicrobia bacterium ADurb.Bin474]|nr:MAG: hypothetical protein BWY82_01866 [Verrucomicrobia bacterium ADurb.Bin474]
MGEEVERGRPFYSTESGIDVTETEQGSRLVWAYGVALNEGVKATVPCSEVDESAAAFEMKGDFSTDLGLWIEVRVPDFVSAAQSRKHGTEAFCWGRILAGCGYRSMDCPRPERGAPSSLE